ncbi:hypothetical protein ENBRE01_1192 [Enteropsectra breve]|nr:hypothetical protein ENBRE01_1192 [Enteropsectra breve]
MLRKRALHDIAVRLFLGVSMVRAEEAMPQAYYPLQDNSQCLKNIQIESQSAVKAVPVYTQANLQECLNQKQEKTKALNRAINKARKDVINSFSKSIKKNCVSKLDPAEMRCYSEAIKQDLAKAEYWAIGRSRNVVFLVKNKKPVMASIKENFIYSLPSKKQRQFCNKMDKLKYYATSNVYGSALRIIGQNEDPNQKVKCGCNNETIESAAAACIRNCLNIAFLDFSNNLQRPPKKNGKKKKKTTTKTTQTENDTKAVAA